MIKIVVLNPAECAEVGGAGVLQELLEAAARELKAYFERLIEPQV